MSEQTHHGCRMQHEDRGQLPGTTRGVVRVGKYCCNGSNDWAYDRLFSYTYRNRNCHGHDTRGARVFKPPPPHHPVVHLHPIVTPPALEGAEAALEKMEGGGDAEEGNDEGRKVYLKPEGGTFKALCVRLFDKKGRTGMSLSIRKNSPRPPMVPPPHWRARRVSDPLSTP